MVIDLKKLRATGKVETNISSELELPEDLIENFGYDIKNPTKFNGHLSIMKDSVFVDGKIDFTLEGECFRCLEKTKINIEIDFLEQYLNRIAEDNYSYKNDLLDLTKAVADYVLLNLPASLLCKDECKGLCPECGVNLNFEKCKCNKD